MDENSARNKETHRLRAQCIFKCVIETNTEQNLLAKLSDTGMLLANSKLQVRLSNSIQVVALRPSTSRRLMLVVVASKFESAEGWVSSSRRCGHVLTGHEPEQATSTSSPLPPTTTLSRPFLAGDHHHGYIQRVHRCSVASRCVQPRFSIATSGVSDFRSCSI